MTDFINIYLEQYKNNSAKNTQETALPNNNYTSNQTVSGKKTGMSAHANSAKNRLYFSQKSYPDIREMYAKINNDLDQEGRVLLNQLYKNGKLLSRDSNDGTSTLENLYTIMTEPRVPVFDKKNIAEQTLKTLHDPYLITQKVGKIPSNRMASIIEAENKRLQLKIQQARTSKNFNPYDISDNYPIKHSDLFNINGSTCAAASIEFNLAHRRPAEFVRYVEGLTSVNKSVKTRLKYSDLSPDMMESLAVLTRQNSDFRNIGWDTVEVTVKPDKNAYLRADIQEDSRVKNTRSMVDVLIQSAFMQLGSRKTYNSLTDKRSGEVGEGEGLNQFEIAFVESIVDSQSKKIPIVYMELDNDLTKVLNYTYDFEQTKKQFLKSLDQGHNIITGFLIDVDKNGNVIVPQGHEILLTGYKYDNKGKLWFKYNDTDDHDYFAPSWMEADSFMPKVHHANIPQNALEQQPVHIPIGYLYLNDYRTLQNMKKA